MLSKEDRENMELALREDYEVCIWGAGYVGTNIGFHLLEKNGISVNCFCDNNREMWGNEVIKGIVCIPPEELQKKKDHIICFLMMGTYYYEAVFDQAKKMGLKRIIKFNDLFEEETGNYFPFMRRSQIAIYTCIVGGYDDLQEPVSVLPNCDYFIISDRPPAKKSIFQYIDIRDVLPEDITDNTRKNRYCKINAHKIFSQYRFSIYFDGNIQLKTSAATLVNKLPKTRIIAWCPNYWKSIYREVMSVLMNKKEEEGIILRQAEKYWMEGMPEDFGCLMCGILVREHNHPVCSNIMEQWWQQVKEFSKRDQISFPYVLWKNGYDISDVGLVAEKFEYGQPEGEHWSYTIGHKGLR